MDFFDERILNVLKDGKPRVFNQILNAVGFSHNTLRLHLDFLVDQGFIVKEKKPSKGLGRPAFTHSIPPKVKRSFPHPLRPLHRGCLHYLQPS
jgi:predicted ArsR family transcriptional regulator